MARANGAGGDRLRLAQQRLQRWRQGRRRPGRMPNELWLLAAQAAAEVGIDETASQLQLSAQRLEQWVQQLEPVRRPTQPARAEFVELPPLPWGPPAECEVELEHPSGRKVRICLKGSAVNQLASLLPALCGQEVGP